MVFAISWILYIFGSPRPLVLPFTRLRQLFVGHLFTNMGAPYIPCEILLMVAEHLSVKDLSMLRSTSHRLSTLLYPLYETLCLQDTGKLTALQWAAVRGQVSLIKLAISKGAAIDEPMWGRLDRSALGTPDKRFSDILICKLANGGEAMGTYGGTDGRPKLRTPLFLAACCGHAQAIEALLELGAKINGSGELDTPAHISARRGDVCCLQAFIAHGFDLEARGSRGQTILHDAVIGGEEITQYLLQLGGKTLVHARASDGSTPLHSAAQALYSPYWMTKENRANPELLLRHGADIYARDVFGYTPAHNSARSGDIDCLRVLVTAGFDFRARGFRDHTILHVAVLTERKAVVEFISEQDGGRKIIDLKNDRGSTPLHYAVAFHQRVLVKLLLRHGADIYAVDGDGYTPAHRAARYGVIECLKAIIGAGIDLDAKGPKGRTVLHLAVKHGHMALVEYLLERAGAGRIINAADNAGSTALHLVSNNCKKGIVTLLLRHGANMQARNLSGQTPVLD